MRSIFFLARVLLFFPVGLESQNSDNPIVRTIGAIGTTMIVCHEFKSLRLLATPEAVRPILVWVLVSGLLVLGILSQAEDSTAVRVMGDLLLLVGFTWELGSVANAISNPSRADSQLNFETAVAEEDGGTL